MTASHSNMSVIGMDGMACAAASRRQRQTMAMDNGARRAMVQVTCRKMMLGGMMVAGRFVGALTGDVGVIASRISSR